MIVGILGPGGCGGTFLDWTIQYLSGQTHTWFVACGAPDRSHIVKQLAIDLTTNPLTNVNAHGHYKTHPNRHSVDSVIDAFNKHPEFKLSSFYFVDLLAPTDTQTNYNDLILRYPDVKFITYNFSESDVDLIFCLQHEKRTQLMELALNKKKFSNSDVEFQHMQIWDQRELLSLYYPEEIRGQTIVEIVKPAANNFSINFVDAIENLDVLVNDIFKYIGVEIVQERFEHWLQIYNNWKQYNSLHFFNDLDSIVQSILSNESRDLTQYNMSFAKEVVIASNLLYKHNLAIKSYNVTNLSDNTKQWAEILEPNVYHDLTKK